MRRMLDFAGYEFFKGDEVFIVLAPDLWKLEIGNRIEGENGDSPQSSIKRKVGRDCEKKSAAQVSCLPFKMLCNLSYFLQIVFLLNSRYIRDIIPIPEQ